MKPAFQLKNSSRIYIGSAREILPEVLPAGHVVVVTDAVVDALYHSIYAQYPTIIIERGERHKTLRTLDKIYRRLIALGADRKTFLLAVGGGIVTDTAGFAASTYMRGIRFGFISTTLLGQVDASVGGKNGVNLDGYKNMVGTFTQPQFVICDPTTLQSLPEREFRAGLAEVIKSAIIADAPLFERLEATDFATLRNDPALLGEVIRAAVKVKADIVERDERESGDRRLLNLGHTLAHAIEKSSRKMIHGEAVAVGTLLITEAACRMGHLAPTTLLRIEALLAKMNFRLTPPVAVEQLLGEVGKDKKSEAGKIHIVLPYGIGDCRVVTMEQEEFKQLFRAE